MSMVRTRATRGVRGVLGASAALICLLSAGVAASAPRTVYDSNHDGLIEINDLQDLNAIRNCPAGDSLYGRSDGCPATGCSGFFLNADLNFDTSGNGSVGEEDQYFEPTLG